MKRLLLLIVATLFVACGPQEKSSTLYYNALNWDFKTSGNMKFSDRHKTLIKSAMNVLANRVDSSKVWSCAKNNSRRWKVNNSGQDITTIERFRSFVTLHENAYRSSKIPKVTFIPYNENTNSMGRAYVGGYVRAEFVPTTSFVPMYNFTGSFDVQLNLSQLNDEEWNDANVWAGVIFHEMLHQMGYNHDVGRYDDDMFITVMGDCVQENGTFYSRRPGFNLAGRKFPIPD